MRLGILFAGQGSQKPGMGKDLYENYPQFRQIFDLLPQEQRKIAFEGTAEDLADTRNTQPVMVAFAAGVMAVLRSELKGMQMMPQMGAGLSLGEYSALHAAGVWDAETTLRLVAFRAQEMYKAAQGVDCRMTAVIGLDRNLLADCCRKSREMGTVQIANYNCPGQIVIAGEKKAVECCGELALEAGARRCIPLAVSGPFHTVFMEPAGKALENVFSSVDFGEMDFPVIFNYTGRPLEKDRTVAEMLVRQVSSSVYFEDTIRTMEEAGIDTVLEIGPGKALSGFVKKTCRQMRCFNIEDCDSLQKTVQELIQLKDRESEQKPVSE